MKHNLVTCTALVAFTEFVPYFGQVHGDPNNPDAKHPRVPEQVVQKLVDAGRIADPETSEEADPDAPVSQFAAAYKPVGKWEITGPGLSEPLVIAGDRAAAEAKIAELEQANTDGGDGGDDDGDENDAPTA